MPRLPNQRVLKAPCSPLRNPPHNLHCSSLHDPLRNLLRNPHKRYIYEEHAPFSGHPSYATIIRRFSSQPNPLDYFALKKAKEAKERGEFIDIHDIGGIDPNNFNVLITDIDDNSLQNKVSELIGIPYLKEATEDEANDEVEIGHCIIYGMKQQTIFPCIVRFKNQARWVFFIIDSGSPLTYLSVQAAKAFGITGFSGSAFIAGRRHTIYAAPDNRHFSDINLLGSDFINAHIPIQERDFNEKKEKLYFNSNRKWAVKLES